MIGNIYASEIILPIWFWLLYHLVIAILIIIDLVVARRREALTYREAVIWSIIWVGAGVLWGLVVLFIAGTEAMGLYYAAFLVEKMLSMDNLFVFAVIFSYFNVPLVAQPVVLYVGIISAVVMRALFIYGGLWLIERYHWIIFVFGAILFYTGIKLLRERVERMDPARNPIVKFSRKFLPITPNYAHSKFIIKTKDGKKLFTPLILVLIAVETTDLMFAFDSVPAVIAITMNFFIAYTSNISAILGLRALYFVIAITMFKFKYVGKGLSAVLIFLGIKLFLSGLNIIKIPTWISIAVVFIIIVLSILFSLKEKE